MSLRFRGRLISAMFRLSSGCRQFSADTGSNPVAPAKHRSVMFLCSAGASSNGRARGHEDSSAILNAVTDSMWGAHHNVSKQIPGGRLCPSGSSIQAVT